MFRLHQRRRGLRGYNSSTSHGEQQREATLVTIPTPNSTGYKTIWLKPVKGAASHLVRIINDSLAKGFRTFKIKIKDGGEGLYPNICLPIAGTIEYYSSLGCQFLPSRSSSGSSYASIIGLLNPYSNPLEVRQDAFLDKIWRINANTHYQVVTGTINSLRKAAVMSSGVLNALELCLNEISDNILVHSTRCEESSPSGLVMAQYHKSTGRIAISVYDQGIGIPASLKKGGIAFENTKDAILLSMQAGVTDGKGAGNGLWLLKSIIEQGRGSLEITSDGVRYSLIHREDSSSRETFSKSLSLIGGTTLVDFQLDVSQPIELDKVLGPNGFIDLWMEEREEDWDGTIVRLNVAKEADGLGSRIDGSSFRNLVLNVMSSAQTVILDFSNVSLVSLSFADEAVGKLIDTIGFGSFLERIKIEQANETCLTIIQTIISQHPSGQES